MKLFAILTVHLMTPFVGIALAGEDLLQLTQDVETNTLVTLDEAIGLEAAGQRQLFDEGPGKDTKALVFQLTESPHSGVQTTLRNFQPQGSVEVVFRPDGDVPETQILVNLGSGGNSKWSLSLLPDQTIQAVFLSWPEGETSTAIKLRSGPVSSGEWHHVALTWSPDDGVKLYLDGKLADEAEGPIFPWKWDGDMLSIGDGPDYSPEQGGGWMRIDNNFIGRIYQVRVSNVKREF